MIEMPVTSSPLSMVCMMGEAPRHRGRTLACTFRIPLQKDQLYFIRPVLSRIPFTNLTTHANISLDNSVEVVTDSVIPKCNLEVNSQSLHHL